MSNWDDYRFLLAVADAGSLSGAARALQVTQPTVGRRISDLERALGLELFDRVREGYRLTGQGERVCAQARLMELQATRIELAARTPGAAPDRVCVTASEGLCYAMVTTLLARFSADHPAIGLDLIISNQAADILRHEAHIAVRMGDPRSEALLGRRIGAARFGLYGHDGYLARHGFPETPEDLANHAIIESTGDITALPQAVWLRTTAQGARVAYSSNSLVNQTRALSDGVGLLALPTYLAQDLVGVRRVLANVYNPEMDVWILTERRLRGRDWVGRVLDYLTEEIGATLKRVTG